MYEIGLTHDAQKFYQTADIPLTRKLNRCFDQLQRDPYGHPNIKRLKGLLAGYWRYRMGDWRVVYRVDEDKQVITVILIAHRSKIYR
jgi:mRNA interferase RelE/StbE